MESLVELLETSAGRYASRHALGLRRDDGSTLHWTYAELLHRSRIAGAANER